MNAPWHRPKQAVQPATGSNTVEDIGADTYAAHARWLLEWHNKRSETFSSRAVTLLGFNGAVLALLVNAGRFANHDGWHLLKWTILVAVAGLVLSAYHALFAMAPFPNVIPDINQLREHWDVALGNTEGIVVDPTAQVVESFLRPDESGKSPLDTAYEDANRRAKHFKVAVAALVGAMAVLAVITVIMFVRM